MSRRPWRWAAGVSGFVARVLVAWYPGSFRRELGDALVDDFRRRGAEVAALRGRRAFGWWLMRGALSLVANGLGEWGERIGAGASGHGGRPDPSAGGSPSYGERAARLLRGAGLAGRSLRRTPGFTALVIVTLALGIGGTTAMFSVVRGVLIAPLPYSDPGALVRLYQYDGEEPEEPQYVSGVHFKGYRARVTAFEDLAALYTYRAEGADLTSGDAPQRVRLLPVSADYFRVLRQPPSRGRTFTRAEERGDPLAIVSERLWRRLSAAGLRLGDAVELDGRARLVVGVMPASFEDPVMGRVDVWVPLDLYGSGAEVPDNHFLTVIGRLAPGVDAERARGELAVVDAALAERYPEVAEDRGLLFPLHQDVVSHARPALLLLMGGVGLVLLIACVNVANLMMVRSLGRARELAVRSALGARRGQIAGQLLTESLLLAGIGGLAGVALAFVGTNALLAVGGEAVPRAGEVAVDGAALGFAAVTALLSGLAFGMVPALRLSAAAPAMSLRASGRGSSGGRRHIQVRAMLVAGQVALALMLLLGASALGASLLRLARVELGIRTEHVWTFELNLPAGRYDSAARAEFHRSMTDRLARLPGVTAVAATSRLPATGTYHGWGTRPLTGPLAGDEGTEIGAEQRVVAGDYFDALGIPLIEGRTFREGDDAGGRPVAVVSRSVARRLFPGAPALGQRIRMGGVEREIVGVVEDVALDAEGRPAAHVYHAHAQFAGNRNWALTYLIAAERDPAALMPDVRRAIGESDRQLVLHRPQTLEEALGQGRGTRRFAFLLSALFAGLALALAALGLYGVLAHVVRQRTREIGIRIALGADQRKVAALVVRRGLLITLAGLLVGVAGSLAVARVMASLTYRTEPTDPAIVLAAATTLLLAALAAVVVPAVRAARVPPRVALAEE